MTPEDAEPAGLDPTDLAPEDDAAVRRLLRAASEPSALPAHVAARLDDTLAGLLAERDAEAAPPAVVELAARRRRRWPTVLVAAATVGVVALGVGEVVRQGQQQNATTAGAGAASDTAGRAEANPAATPAPGEGALSGGPVAPDGRKPAVPRDRAGVPTLRTVSLAADVQRVVDFSLGSGTPTADAFAGPCRAPVTGPGEERLAVRLDGRPATLVLRPERHRTRQAQVYLCDDATSPEASTTVDVP